MHDKIKALLPKEMRKEECTCSLSAPFWNCESEGDYDIGQRDGYNQALAEVHAKIPEIVALVEGEVRKNLKIGMLRQWLNEKPKDMLVTNEQIEKFLFWE